jgi:hypothetical protein
MDILPAVAPTVALVALVLLAITIGCLLGERSAHQQAWRRIADERRRNRTDRDEPPGS